MWCELGPWQGRKCNNARYVKETKTQQKFTEIKKIRSSTVIAICDAKMPTCCQPPHTHIDH